MSAAPSSAVAIESVASVVATIVSCGSSAIASATSPAIFDRKMSPASCTCPMANGSDDEAVNAVWWTADEKRTSFTCEVVTRKGGDTRGRIC